MIILREPHRRLALTQAGVGWREVLSDPPRHWRDNPATDRLANMWASSAPDLPAEVCSAWLGTPFENFQPTVTIPAYEVEMPGGWQPVPNDILIVGVIGEELGIVMVQGKVGDSLGPSVGEVLHNPLPGKLRRIGFLADVLELPDQIPGSTCYHLLDRAACPLIEARRLGADYAAMIVTVFGPAPRCHEEFRAFARLCGANGEEGRLERLPAHENPELWIAWVDGPEPSPAGVGTSH